MSKVQSDIASRCLLLSGSFSRKMEIYKCMVSGAGHSGNRYGDMVLRHHDSINTKHVTNDEYRLSTNFLCHGGQSRMKAPVKRTKLVWVKSTASICFEHQQILLFENYDVLLDAQAMQRSKWFAYGLPTSYFVSFILCLPDALSKFDYGLAICTNTSFPIYTTPQPSNGYAFGPMESPSIAGTVPARLPS